MPSFKILRGGHNAHQASNAATRPNGDPFDPIACRNYGVGETFWSPIDVIAKMPHFPSSTSVQATWQANNHDKFYFVTPSTYSFGADDAGLSDPSYAPELLNLLIARYSIDISGLQGYVVGGGVACIEPQTVANFVAAAIDALFTP